MPDTATATAAKRPRNPRRLIPLFVAAAALAYGAYRLYLSRRPYEWSGTVEARTISVGSRTGGRVKEVLVREGDRVAEGQALLVLEPGDLGAQRLEGKGQLDQAQANLAKLERGARPEEIQQAKARAQTADAALEETRIGARREQVQAAAARLQSQQVALDKAELDAQRTRSLVSKGAASRMELDNAESALRGALAQRDAAKEALEELTHGSRKQDLTQAEARALEARAGERLVVAGTRVEDLAVARGQVEVAQGRLDAIEVSLGELTVRAPRPARVEALDLRPGDLLAQNATAATLLEEDQLYVRIYIPETLIGHIRPGQQVPVTVDSFPGRVFQGVVEHINSVGEYSPRNLQTADERADQVFATRVGLRDGKSELRAGMAAFIAVPR